MSVEKDKQVNGTRLFARVVICCLAVFLCMNMMVSSEAKTIVHIQTSIDLTTWEILSAVVRDDIGLTGHSPEVRRVDSSVLKDLASGSVSLDASIAALDGLSQYITSYDSDQPKQKKLNGNFIGGVLGSGEKNRVLTFPGKNISWKDSTTDDMNKAMTVNDALIFDLNQAFSLWLEEKGTAKSPNVELFYNEMKSFLSALTPNGNKVIVAGETFTWRVEKGYGTSDDAQYINWGMLAYEAFNNFVLEGDEAVTSENVYSANPGQLEKAIVAVLGNMLDGLRGILGMWSVDDLIFSQGFRDNGYVGGVFPKTWEPTIWALFIIMEVLAAIVLMYGIIVNVIQKAMSTVNTIARIHMMSKIQDMIICAVALTLLPVALRICLALSSDLTGMVYALIDDGSGSIPEVKDLVNRYAAGGGTIAGIIAQFLFFGVQVYFNFFYALRSLTVAALIIIAPIMIALVSISDGKKQQTISWMKELIANIFIQPIHAFLMIVILILPRSSHGFDNLIALYALIPLTSAIRSMFFGNSGSWMDQAAQKAKGKMTGALAGAGLAAGGALVGGGITAVHTKKATGSGAAEDTNGGPDGGHDPGQELTGNDTQTVPPDPSTPEVGVGGNTSDLSAMSRGEQQEAKFKAIPAGAANLVKAAGQALGDKFPKGRDFAASTAQKVSGGAQNISSSVSKATSEFAKDHPLVTGFAKNAGKPIVCVGGKVVEGAKNLASDSLTFANGAVSAIPGAALAGFGGVLTGAGINNNFTQLGSRFGGESARMKYTASRPQQGGKADDDSQTKQNEEENSDVEKSGDVQSGDDLNVPATDIPSEMGSGGSTFKNHGEVLNKDNDLVQRYAASAAVLGAAGIAGVESTRDEITAEMDPSKGGEAADMAGYADYLQTLTPEERKDTIQATGISATRLSNGKVHTTINKDRWSKAHGGASIRTTGKRGEPQGLQIEAPVGSSSALVGGLSVPRSINCQNAGNISTASTQQSRFSMHGEAVKRLDNGHVASGEIISARRVKTVPAKSPKGRESEDFVKQYISKSSLSSEQAGMLDKEIANQQAAHVAGESYASNLNGVQNVRLRGNAYEITRSAETAHEPIVALPQDPPPTPYKQYISSSDLTGEQRAMLDAEIAGQTEARKHHTAYTPQIEGVQSVRKHVGTRERRQKRPIRCIRSHTSARYRSSCD